MRLQLVLHASVSLLAMLFVRDTLSAQQTHPDSLSLAGQIGMHYYIHDRIVAALPTYVDFESNAPCSMVVYMMDPDTWGDSARALFRHALPADTSELSRSYCAARPEVQVRKARYTLVELGAFSQKITTVLKDPALKVRSSVRVRPETLIVGAHNTAALERARKRLVREKKLPHSMLAYRVWKPEEVDGPVAAPRAVYLAVLDTIAAAPAEHDRRFVIDPRSLPPVIGDEDLRQRGLHARQSSDSCAPVTVVSFRPPRQFVDGRYALSVGWRLNDYYYEVECPTGTCRVRRTAQLPGDKISLGCASAAFGADR